MMRQFLMTFLFIYFGGSLAFSQSSGSTCHELDGYGNYAICQSSDDNCYFDVQNNVCLPATSLPTGAAPALPPNPNCKNLQLDECAGTNGCTVLDSADHKSATCEYTSSLPVATTVAPA